MNLSFSGGSYSVRLENVDQPLYHLKCKLMDNYSGDVKSSYRTSNSDNQPSLLYYLLKKKNPTH